MHGVNVFALCAWKRRKTAILRCDFIVGARNQNVRAFATALVPATQISARWKYTVKTRHRLAAVTPVRRIVDWQESPRFLSFWLSHDRSARGSFHYITIPARKDIRNFYGSAQEMRPPRYVPAISAASESFASRRSRIVKII